MIELKNEMFMDKSFSRAGFTLIEVLMASGILSGIVLVITLFGFNIFNLQLFMNDSLVIQQEIGLTLTSMGIEVRAIGPSANGSYYIESATNDSLIFYSDIDGDNYFERVRYFVAGGILKKGIIKPTGNPAVYLLTNEVVRNLVNNVILPPTASQPLFVYYDQNYNGSQPPLQSPIAINRIRLIKVTVTADKTPQNISGQIDYSSTMLIRNLKNVQ